MNKLRYTLLIALAGSLAACAQQSDDDQGPATVAEAEAFVERMDTEGREYYLESAKAAWLASTYITPDSMAVSAKANERAIIFNNGMIEASKRFNDLELDGETDRAIMLTQQGSSMPAPSDVKLVQELTALATELEGMYGSGKYEDEDGEVYDLGELSQILADFDMELDPAEDFQRKVEAWLGWRTVSPPMRDKYTRFVELMNQGATELGYADTADLWKSKYDMSAEDFEAEAARLWGQVEPLYEQLHCYVRDGLADHYGEDLVSRQGPIPAHVLGNMWSQEWSNVYKLVKPYDSELNLDVGAELERRRDAKLGEVLEAMGGPLEAKPQEIVDAGRAADIYIAEEMTRFAEGFYTSMGLTELPESFWERSMLVQPVDHDAVCHASAWPMDGDTDVRMKMCIKPTEEELRTIYHELGHIYYYLYYQDLPLYFQSGAHDGFHEAIGDAITLSMTPEYLQREGLISNYQPDAEALINSQMKLALDKVAFLPFGKMIDEWRWRVFSGEIGPEAYNQGWWDLRTRYQGIAPPAARNESDFDPGAKYHVPGNTPYTRYFLAHILQFQFHKSMCEAAGYEGPLHACSVYGSEEAGERLAAMLELGQSKPWPEALEAMTGSPQMDASALIEYFAPLQGYLEEANAGKQCGW